MAQKYNYYETFSNQIDFGDYFETHDGADLPDVIRAFHNEFSGLFIKKVFQEGDLYFFGWGFFMNSFIR